MRAEVRSTLDNNVVSFAEARQRRLLARRLVPEATPDAIEAGKELVLFVTGGRFECMVNGASAVLGAGEFVRVPEGAACAVRDVGRVPGSIVSHSFARGIDSRFYGEVAAALPPYSTSIPRSNSRAFAKLLEIAQRWGVSFDRGAAA